MCYGPNSFRLCAGRPALDEGGGSEGGLTSRARVFHRSGARAMSEDTQENESPADVMKRWAAGGFTDADFEELIRHEPWKRQPGESAQRFEAFARWLQKTPRERSMWRIAVELGLPVERLEQWALNEYWEFRTECFDRFYEHLWRRERTAAMRQQMASEAELFVQTRRRATLTAYHAMDRHLRLEESTTGVQDPPHNVTDAIRLLEWSKSVRDVGESNESDRLDFSGFSNEELSMYQRLRRKAAGAA